jgi:hypothetical protein
VSREDARERCTRGDPLLEVYGRGTWVSPAGHEEVDHIDVATLGTHAYTLILRDPSRG